MLFLAESRFKISQASLVEDGSFAESRFEVDVDPATSDSRFQVETIGGGALALGAASSPQEAWLTVTHAGVKRYDGQFPEGFEIAFAAEGTSWSLPTQGYHGDEIGAAAQIAWHGRAIDRGAAPPGSDPIDFAAEVQFPGITGATSYPIATGTRSWSSREPLMGYAPTVLQGGDYLSRFAGIEVEYDKALGVSSCHGQFISGLLRAAGVPAARISVSPTLGEPILKLVESRCVDGVAEARAIAEAAGHWLVTDGAGDVVARHMAPIHQQPVAEITLPLAETAEVDAEVTAETQGVPRCWKIMGTRPEIPEDADGYVTTRRLESRVTEPYTVPASWSQSAAGAISAFRAASTSDRITSELWVTEVFYQGCLVRRIRETWGQYNPEVWRYKTANPASSDGEPRTYSASVAGGGFVYGAGAAKDDTLPMRQWEDFRLAPISIEQVDFLRTGDDLDSITGLPKARHTGALKQVITSTAQWKALENHWKTNTSDATPWTQENVAADIRYFAGGRPIAGLGAVSEVGGFAQELFFAGPLAPSAVGGMSADSTAVPADHGIPAAPAAMRVQTKWAAQTVEDIDLLLVDAGDSRDTYFESRRVATTEGYGKNADVGDSQFKDGAESASPTEIGQDQKVVTKDFVPEGEGSHAVSTLELDGRGRFVRATFDSGQPSYLPIAEVCNAELLGLAETVDVEGTYCIVSASGDYVDRTEEETSEWIETPSFARSVACIKLRRASALTATLSMPFSPIFYHGAPIKFTVLHKGIDPAKWAEPSNAWVEDPVLTVVRDNSGVRKILKMNIRIRII